MNSPTSRSFGTRGRTRTAWSSAPLVVALGVACFLALLLQPVYFRGKPRSASPAFFPADSPAVTFNKDVAPIIFKNCAPCHHSKKPAVPSHMESHLMAGHMMMHHGGMAQFSLLDYPDVKKMAKQISAVTKNHSMPPWKAVPGYGEFRGFRGLTEAQIRTIQQWVEEGTPEGRPGDLPPVPHFADSWRLGHPDLILKMAKPYTLPAEGSEFSRCFVIPARLAQDKYITGLEIKPSDSSLVHHAILVEDLYGAGRRLEKSPGSGYACSGGFGFPAPGYFGFYTMGVLPKREPKGVARVLKKGSDFVIQVHFHPAGQPLQEQIELGLYLAPKPTDKIPMNVTVSNYDIDIAPGNANYQLKGFAYLPADVEVLSIFAHAHMLAREAKASATLPDGTVKPLLWVKNWDPHWQEDYWYAFPFKLPQGTRVDMEIDYDNSAGNPRNMNHPPKHILWGQHSTDEMGEIHLQVIPLHQETAQPESDHQKSGDKPHESAEATSPSSEAGPRASGLSAGRNADLQAAELHSSQGAVLEKQGNLADAIKEYRQAAQLQPGWAAPHLHLGIVLQTMGDVKEAIHEFKIAAKLDPQDLAARRNLGLALLHASQWEEAARAYRALIRLDPTSPDDYYNLALASQQAGDLAGGETALKKCLELKPDFAEAHVALANIFYAQGMPSSAEAQCRAAITTHPNDARALYLLATLLKQQGKTEKARDALKTVIRIDPRNGGAHLGLGMILKEEGDLDGSAAELREGEVLREAEMTFRAALLASETGGQLLRQGDLEGSTQKFRFALKIAPNFAWAHYQLGVALWEKHEYAQASAEFEAAHRLDARFKVPTAPETTQGNKGIGSEPN